MIRVLGASALVGCAFAAQALASATPIGSLPAGPTTSVTVQRGQLVAVALPRQKASTGLVWRLARNVSPRVVRQVSEANVDSSVVIVYRAVGTGSATISYALTCGDSSPKALRSSTYKVRVVAPR